MIVVPTRQQKRLSDYCIAQYYADPEEESITIRCYIQTANQTIQTMVKTSAFIEEDELIYQAYTYINRKRKIIRPGRIISREQTISVKHSVDQAQRIYSLLKNIFSPAPAPA